MSEMIAIDQLGQTMTERLKMLDAKREDTVEATSKKNQAIQAEDASIQRYNEAIAEVREEGLLTDKLLTSFGHQVVKRRTGPKSSSTKKTTT
jgi:hypothetical protein